MPSCASHQREGDLFDGLGMHEPIDGDGRRGSQSKLFLISMLALAWGMPKARGISLSLFCTRFLTGSLR
ncbi:hypothetical protein [Prochlorococcus sp. MIT 0702]|uniref:hypothetical protein n=1 Tax=Prochlorococcus sp. MIT 0702 TaxID=1499503 RepID=UPI000A7EE6D5|nr:hypothetical protein [Prochlorococcus sp. MIT 0702]